jgi:hypothetical protein
MAGTVPIIMSGTITEIKGLENRPVYFLHLNDSPTPTVVVKGERKGFGTAQSDTDVKLSVHWTSKLMKNVNSKQVNSQAMTPNEVSAFRHAATLTFKKDSAQYGNVEDVQAFNWVKMPFVPGLSDAGYNDAKAGEKTIIIKAAIKNLLNPEAWIELGKVVAVDVFNANNDRFNIKTGDWVNKGNIMFNDTGKVLGLDTFDPSSFGGNNDLAPGCSNLMTGNNATYQELKMLKDPSLVPAFATKCLLSMGRAFQSHLKDTAKLEQISYYIEGKGYVYILTPDLEKYFYKNYLQYFVLGFNEGAKKLKEYLKRKTIQYNAPTRSVMPNLPAIPGQRPATPSPMGRNVAPMRPQSAPPQQKSLPQGVQARMQYLGW